MRMLATIALIGIGILAAATALARDADVPAGDRDRDDGGRRISRHDGHVRIGTTDDTRLRIVTGYDGDQVMEFDLSLLDLILDDALDVASEALAGLGEMDLDLRFDDDGSFTFARDDELMTVDLGALLVGVDDVVREALDELAEEDWRVDFDDDGYRHRDDLDAQGEIEVLEEELAALRAELSRLERDLRRARRARDR